MLFMFSLVIPALSQESGIAVGFEMRGRDTVFLMNMKAIYVFPKLKNRRNTKEWREYYRLVYNFRKTYPYALLAKEKINEADSVLASRHFTGKAREKYIKSFETKLFKEFEKPLVNMSFSQGKLLLKLVDREVGQSSFYLIKNYKGGLTATLWQGVARIFGSDLKKPYDKYGEDKNTEELVIMYQNGSFEYLYYSMFY